MNSHSSLLTAVLICAACASPSGERLSTYQRFLELDSKAAEERVAQRDAVVRGGGAFETRSVRLHGDTRPSLVLTAPADFVFQGTIHPDASFRFSLAVRPPEAPLRICLTRETGESLHEETWQEERGWVERSIPLGSLAGQRATLRLSFEGPRAEVMLANPELVGRDPGARAGGPNVIVYVVDCLRADHVGAYGYGLPTTPHLDAMAAESVLFEDLTACAPWTKPSTACLFTSLSPVDHRASTVDDALGHQLLTLAEVLRDAGYATAAFVANQVIEPRVFFFNQGFDRWTDLRSFEERSTQVNIGVVAGDAADITQELVPWLERNRDRRFFVYLHSIDLHYSYRPRPPYDALFVAPESEGLERDRQLYDNELAYNDREIGRLRETLERLGLWEDALVLVTADHGEEFGEHELTRHGKTLYREALHIPGILKLPGSAHAGLRVEALASNLDLAPTLLDYAGVAFPEVFQGRSMRAVLEGRTVNRRPDVVAELVAPNVVSYAVRDERYKYLRQLMPEQDESLFDLQEDPAERRNLLPSVPPKARKLISRLDDLVLSAQHGLHVSVTGQPPGRNVRLEAETDGEFERAFRFGIVTGDLFDLGSSRKRLTLAFTSDDAPRQLVMQTRPENAPVSLQVMLDESPLARAAYRLGADAREPETLRPLIEPKLLEVTLERSEELLHERDPGVRVWYLPRASRRNPVELDAETLQYLRALGYIE